MRIVEDPQVRSSHVDRLWSRWLILLLAGICPLLIALASVSIARRNITDALGPCPPDFGDEKLEVVRRVGERLYFAYSDLCPKGSELIHILDADIVDRPDGLRVHGFYAADARKTHIMVADVTPEGRKRRRPLTDVVIDPSKTVAAGPVDRNNWYILVELSADRPGEFWARKLRVYYRVGSKRGVRDYENYTFGIKACPKDSPPVCKEVPGFEVDAP